MRRRVPDTTRLRALTGWAPTRTLDGTLTEFERQARLTGPVMQGVTGTI